MQPNHQWQPNKHTNGQMDTTLWQVNLWLGIYKDAPLVPFYKDSECLTCLKVPKLIKMLGIIRFYAETTVMPH